MVLPEDFLGLGEGTITPAENGNEKTTILRALNAEGKVPRDAEGKPYSAESLAKLDVNTLRILRANVPATVPVWQRRASPAVMTTGAKGRTGLARAIAEHEAGR